MFGFSANFDISNEQAAAIRKDPKYRDLDDDAFAMELHMVCVLAVDQAISGLKKAAREAVKREESIAKSS